MSVLNKILTGVIVFIAGIIYALLPSIDAGQLMNGTQSGKSILFLAVILLLAFLFFFRFAFSEHSWSFRLSIPDFAIAIWSIYLFLNMAVKHIPFSLQVFECCGLLFLYVICRKSAPAYYPWIFLSLVLGGGIQAVYGNLQLWGYYPSHHGLFIMTGSFFNPGPYAGYLVSVLLVALGFYLFRVNINEIDRLFTWCNRLLKRVDLSRLPFFKNRKDRPEIKKSDGLSCENYNITSTVAVLAVISIALVLPASRSRAAWLAVVVSAGYLLPAKYPVRNILSQYLNSGLKRAGALLLSAAIVGACFSGLYFLKKGSADGRALVWTVTLDLIRDHPATGVGFDRFKSCYMDYQAAHFMQDPGSAEAMVAGDTNYAFNESLQQTAENGIVGLLLEMLVLLCVFIPVTFGPFKPAKELQQGSNHDEPSSTISGKRIVNYGAGQQTDKYRVMRAIAQAGVLSILAFSLFSYPFQILPIKMNLIFYLAVLSGLSPQATVSFPRISNAAGKRVVAGVKVIAGILLLLVTLTGFRTLCSFNQAYRDWQGAFRVYEMGAYEACLEDYGKAWPELRCDGDFLTNYGKALSMAGQHQNAVDVLHQAAVHYPNTVVYTALGDSYKALGEAGKAEQSYLHAWYMNPSRFYPKYLLAKLYDETGQREKAVKTAKELLNKEIKIESTAIEEIKVEMETIIAK